MVRESGSFCLVANDLDYVIKNGGIGTSNWLTAHLLAQNGWRVHILYCGPAAEPAQLLRVREKLQGAQIDFTALQDLPAMPLASVPPEHLDAEQLRMSEKVRHALESLHSVHCFDLVQFADWDGLGFHTVQAKQTGLAFHDLGIIVKLQGNHPWSREGNGLWPHRPEDWLVDYLERYSFEHADFQLSCSAWFLEYVRQLGWNTEPDARICSLPYPEPLFAAPFRAETDSLELVFFGRLETHKGLEIFLEAVKHLDPSLPLTFLGKPSALRSGGCAIDLIRSSTKGRKVQILTDYNREQALGYLASHNVLVLMPSLGETFGNTIAECAVNGFPFLATGSHGHLDLLPDEGLRGHLFFQSNPQEMLECLNRYLQAPAEQRRVWREQVIRLTDPKEHNQRIVEDYRRCLEVNGRVQRQSAGPAAVALPRPLATIVVTHAHSGDNLPVCLASLARQTYPHLEVIVVGHGPDVPSSLDAFESQKRKYPQFRFVRQEHGGVQESRNRALAEGRGEYHIPLDSSCIAMPDMVEQMVDSLGRNPDWTAATCYVSRYKRTADIPERRFRQVYQPTGGPFVLGAFVNVFGDTTAIFRAAALRDLGGYRAPQGVSPDWWLHAVLCVAGHQIGVIPKYLCCSRVCDSWGAQVISQHVSRLAIRQQYERSPELGLADRRDLWKALFTGYSQLGPTHLPVLRYLLADKANDFLKNAPAVHTIVKRLTRSVTPGSAPAGSPVLRYRLADRANGVVRKVRPLHRFAKKAAVIACLPQLVPWLLSPS